MTEYGAAPIIVSRPAADAVTTNRPPFESASQAGTSTRAARTWAITLVSIIRAQSSSEAWRLSGWVRSMPAFAR